MSAVMSFSSPEVDALKARLRGLSHRELCELLHATYHSVNGAIERGGRRTAEDLKLQKDGERVVRLANAELRSRGLQYVPVYEALWKVTITGTGEVFEVWAPYHAVKPHPKFPSGRPTRNDMIANLYEMDAALEGIRPGLSKEKREPVKFCQTRRRA